MGTCAFWASAGSGDFASVSWTLSPTTGAQTCLPVDGLRWEPPIKLELGKMI